jgi:hypothetical protein
MIDDELGFGRKWLWHEQGTISALAWRDRGKPLNLSVRTDGVLLKIRTMHLLNTSIQHYL